MLIEAARRAEAAAKEMLALVNEGSASCAETREALAISRVFMAAGSAFQVGAAKVIAGAERHGDRGAQVLADTAGLSRREARSQVRTARVIEAAPAVRDAAETGRVPQANIKRLAETIEKTSAAAVESDSDLLAKAQSMRPDQFTREARRWAADRQDDGGEADYRRLRARRCVRIWDSEDGTVELHGTFDPVAGRRIGNRLEAEARRLYDIDKKQAAEAGPNERRTFHQCMADALDHLTADNASGCGTGSGTGKPFADICVVAHLDETTGKLAAETPEGQRLPEAVLEELACNAKFTGVLFDRDGKPIWRAHSVRTATEAQRQILFARYGGCFHCAAHPALCQIHHIRPVSQGGSTKISNMVPVCWDCHQKIHHHDWYIRIRPDGWHTLHPPDRMHYGPAHAPEERSLGGLVQREDPRPAHAPEERSLGGLAQREDPRPAHAPEERSLFELDGSPNDPRPPSARAGPAAARAVLHNARAQRETDRSVLRR